MAENFETLYLDNLDNILYTKFYPRLLYKHIGLNRKFQNQYTVDICHINILFHVVSEKSKICIYVLNVNNPLEI